MYRYILTLKYRYIFTDYLKGQSSKILIQFFDIYGLNMYRFRFKIFFSPHDLRSETAFFSHKRMNLFRKIVFLEFFLPIVAT